MGDDGRVVGDPTEVLTRSGGSSYVSLTAPTADVTHAPVRVVTFVGWLALAVAVLAAVLTGLGVAQVSSGAYEAGTTLAWAAIVLSGAAVAGGILAVIAGFGRVPGAIAIPLGLLANPFLLTRLLEVAGQLTAASAATT